MSRPASLVAATRALASMELRLAMRRGENLLVMLVVPVAVLLFFATVGVVPGIAGRPVDFLLPGTLALAVIATSFVNLGIATAYERAYGVLKRLGGAPITRATMLGAKVATVLVIEAGQVALLVGAAGLALGWSAPAGTSPPLVGAGLLLGTLAFAGLGLLLAGTLRAEATLALANALFLAFLMLGGIVLPIDHLPAPLDALARLLPASALSDVLRAGLGGPGDAAAGLGLLAIWGLAATLAAARSFRWE